MRDIVKLLICFSLLAGCNLPLGSVETSPAPGITPALPVATETRQVITPEFTPGSPQLSEEAILILEPGPGSRLTSPVRVAGGADPAFEQTLGVRIVLDDGRVLASGPAHIQAEIGQRGPFEAELSFEISGERQAFIQVFDSSARDGGVTHLAAVGVILIGEGPQDIIPVQPYRERIAIFSPNLSEQVSGGEVRVEGFALASFEQSLLVEVVDADGKVIGSQPVTVSAEEMGQPGPFSAVVAYSLATAGPGRVVVRDISPAFGGDVHVASVEVRLEP